MKLLIDIPGKTVNEIKDDAMFAKEIESSIKWDITSAIVNSTPFDDVLDKIKAEIEQLTDMQKPEHIWNVDVLAIIDKYKAEREEYEMNKEEAKQFLTDVSYKLGNMSVEYLTEKDGEKMREAIKILEEERCDDSQKAQWIRYEYDRYKCNKCGCKMLHSLPTKYCPNCGREMICVVEKLDEEDD